MCSPQQEKHGGSVSFICLWDYFSWAHLPALQCTLHKHDKMTSRQLPVFTSLQPPQPLPPWLCLKASEMLPLNPQLPWQLFSHWAGYRSLSHWWSDKCNNYVNSVQPKWFRRLNIPWLSEKLSVLKFCRWQSVLHCCNTAGLWFYPSFTISLFHTTFLENEMDGNRETVNLSR